MVTPFYPPHVGGIEYHVSNLSKYLISKGHKITVLTSKQDSSCPVYGNNGIDIIQINTFFMASWPYKSLASVGFPRNTKKIINQIVAEKNIDLIHVHGHHYPLTWAAIKTAYQLKKPTILSLHGLYALNPNGKIGISLEKVFNRLIYKNILNKTTAIFGLTRTITAYAKKYGPSEGRYFTIPNGIHLQKFQNYTLKNYYRSKYNLPLDRTIVLFRGRFADVKGVNELSQAALTIAKTHPESFFIFVGGGPMKRSLEETLAPIKSQCRILNWSSEDEIADLYIAADIFVLPSKSEALPITILEAMASRLHLIVTPVGGIPDVLSDYPWKTYIEHVSPNEIITAFETAFVSFKTKTSAEQACVCRYINNFDWSKIGQDIENIYYTLLGTQTETIELGLISYPNTNLCT